jgi:hypothetical protein
MGRVDKKKDESSAAAAGWAAVAATSGGAAFCCWGCICSFLAARRCSYFHESSVAFRLGAVNVEAAFSGGDAVEVDEAVTGRAAVGRPVNWGLLLAELLLADLLLADLLLVDLLLAHLLLAHLPLVDLPLADRLLEDLLLTDLLMMDCWQTSCWRTCFWQTWCWRNCFCCCCCCRLIAAPMLCVNPCWIVRLGENSLTAAKALQLEVWSVQLSLLDWQQ